MLIGCRTKIVGSLIFILSCLQAFPAFSQDENLSVLDRWVEWSNSRNMLTLYLNKQAFDYLDIREQEIAGLTSKSDWQERQKKIKKILNSIVGQFPDRTPLKPRITGTVMKDGYRIEKVIFESMPDYYVTGCLFIPDPLEGKRPAILNVIGHTLQSFRSHKPGLYQQLILNLVKKGFIVFAIDPMGQGERIQYTVNEKRKVGLEANLSTAEHSYANNQCLLSGYSIAKYWIWDGIRAIDYLLSREEVDPGRIGLTGISGGGMATADIAAFDERIKAAAPANYICGYRRLLESIGVQDGEQNLFHVLKNGIDHADLIEQFAPKPYLMITTTRDFFSIQGARETYKEVKKAYNAFDLAENLTMVEDDYTHGYTRHNREAIYAFFQKNLDLPGDPSDEACDFIDMDTLQITPTGQLATSLGGETIASLNIKESAVLLQKISDSRKNEAAHMEKVLPQAMALSGYHAPDYKNDEVFRGRFRRDGYCIEMYGLPGEGNYVIPLILMIPEGGVKFPAIVYLNPQGKSADSDAGDPMEQLVNSGFIVAAPEVLGTGETEDISGYPGRPGYGAALIGRSMVGIQAGDISRVVRMLQVRNDIDPGKIGVVSFDELCPALLHAAAIDPSISRTMLVNSMISYGEIINHRVYNNPLSFIWGVGGALTAYDLPDLMACIVPRNLYLINLRDSMNDLASQQLIDQELDFPRKVYASKNAGDKLIIQESQFGEYVNVIKNWLVD
jgi:dienelactone hydrolase